MLFKNVLLSAMAALVSAYTQPDYNQPPTGNAITNPGLHDLVAAGKPYTIKWEPTTEGSVSLVLLRGPSTNAQPIHTLAEAIDNSGHFAWTPSAELEPDTIHYGLLLVVEGSGQYQYSTQFGMENPEYPAAASSAGVSSSVPAPTQTSMARDEDDSAGLHNIYSTEEFTYTRCPKCSAEAAAASSSATATPASPSATLTSIPIVAATSSSAASSVAVIPSSSATTPSGAAAASGSFASVSASSSAPSSLFTGAADRNTVGFGAIAAGVLAVLAV